MNFEAIEYNADILHWATEELKNDPIIVLAAINTKGLALEHASLRLRSDYDIVLAAVNENGQALEFASDDLKYNEIIVNAAFVMSDYGESLQFASERLRNDENTVDAAVLMSKGNALEFASDDIKNNERIVRIAVTMNGADLMNANPRFLNDLKTVLVALKTNSLIFSDISDDLQTKLKNHKKLLKLSQLGISEFQSKIYTFQSFETIDDSYKLVKVASSLQSFLCTLCWQITFSRTDGKSSNKRHHAQMSRLLPSRYVLGSVLFRCHGELPDLSCTPRNPSCDRMWAYVL